MYDKNVIFILLHDIQVLLRIQQILLSIVTVFSFLKIKIASAVIFPISYSIQYYVICIIHTTCWIQSKQKQCKNINELIYSTSKILKLGSIQKIFCPESMNQNSYRCLKHVRQAPLSFF